MSEMKQNTRSSRTDTERLDWFAKNPHNVLAHEFRDGSFGFFARPYVRQFWPIPGTEVWQDVRAAIDAAMDVAALSPTGPRATR
jgi:hypothetical protein